MATDYDVDVFFQMMGQTLRGPSGGNRKVCCPLAPFTHRGGTDKHPSMSVRSGTPATYNCFTCHSKGSLKKLAKEYVGYTGDNRPLDFLNSIEKSHSWGKSKRDFGENSKKINERVKIEKKKAARKMTEEKLQFFLRRIPKYAIERGLTKEECDLFEIGYDGREERMIFTIRDYFKTLKGVSGRALKEDHDGMKYKHYYGFKKELVLYGEHLLKKEDKRGYLTEGFFDVIFMKRQVFNVVASMGTSLSSSQIFKLKSFFDEVVICPDFDDKGQGLRFAEESGYLLLKDIKKVGIIGVDKNPEFYLRTKPSVWGDCDFRFKPIPEVLDKDPAEYGSNKETLDF
jgi:DNA primase